MFQLKNTFFVSSIYLVVEKTLIFPKNFVLNKTLNWTYPKSGSHKTKIKMDVKQKVLENYFHDHNSYSSFNQAIRKNHGNLKIHLKFHDKNHPKPFKCQRCDFATHVKANYNYHLKSHENKDKMIATMKNPVKCKKCPAVLRNKYALHNHMKAVHIQALYQCDLCGETVKLKSNVLHHMQVHIKKSR